MAAGHKPMTLMGKHVLTPASSIKRIAYRVKAYTPELPEALYRTTSRFRYYVPSKRMSADHDFDPSWLMGSVKKGTGYMWTPVVYEECQESMPQKHYSKELQSISADTQALKPSKKRNKKRVRTPTMEKESKSSQITPETVLTTSKEENINYSMQWTPLVISNTSSAKSYSSADKRRGSKSKERDDIPTSPISSDKPGSGRVRSPMSNQRGGSSLKTLLGGSPPPARVRLKVDLRDQTTIDKEKLVGSSLRYSIRAQETLLKDVPGSPRRITWSRPASRDGISSNAVRMKTHLTDEISADDMLSATGVRFRISERDERQVHERNRSKSTPPFHTSREAREKPFWKP